MGGATLTTGNDNTSTTFSGTISGAGGLSKIGTGVLTLAGGNTFTGGTTLSAGGLIVSGSLASGITNNGGTLQVAGSVTGNVVQNTGTTALTGNLFGGFTLNGGTASLGGSVTGNVVQNAGTTTMTGTVLGGFTLNAGTASLNGSVAGPTVASGGTLGGNAVFGGLSATGATLSPGNSIGTFTINGNFAQTGGTYVVEVNNSGQSDKINVSGTATINGGAVSVVAQSGNYARNTTYTIVTANGGLSGAYSSVTSNFAFLTPSLTYDANNVYLNLFLSQSAFAAGAQSANQYAVGTVLDQSNSSASGDFNTVLNALAVLSSTQGRAALDAISGQQYADVGTTTIQGGYLFTNAVGQQMAVARSGAGGGQRVAIAEACEIEACDGSSPLAAWASGLGGFGGVNGNNNAGGLVYTFGGAAVGMDYRFDPRFLVGIAVGYAAGNQWVNNFMGRGWSNSVSVTGYGSFTQGGLYVDALAGYAYTNNQMQRQIVIAGLQPRTANGSTGANQALGQIETGYRFAIYAPAQATLTPFGRLQASTVNQSAFSEWGAQSLNLNVAQQTTNSLRTTVGAELNGAVDVGRPVALGLRLGWLHEFADVGRPITEAFSGAPANAFTVYGATPQRDSAVIGFSAQAAVFDAAQLYMRYTGEVGTGADNHAVNVGLRLSF